NAPTSDEKTTALRCLGAAEDPALIQRTLGLASGDEVKNQDIYMPLGGLRSHAPGIEARWNWVKDNWDALYKRLPPGLGMLGNVVQLCTSSFCTEAQLNDVQTFFESKDTKVCPFPPSLILFIHLVWYGANVCRASTAPSSKLSMLSGLRSTGLSGT